MGAGLGVDTGMEMERREELMRILEQERRVQMMQQEQQRGFEERRGFAVQSQMGPGMGGGQGLFRGEYFG